MGSLALSPSEKKKAVHPWSKSEAWTEAGIISEFALDSRSNILHQYCPLGLMVFVLIHNAATTKTL
jgi:hypothetical protein